MDASLPQDPEQAPSADPRPVLERGLDIGDALSRDGGQRRVDEHALGVLVAVENVVLATGFVVERDLDGDARSVRPLGLGRVPAVPHEVARIVAGHVEARLGLLRHDAPFHPSSQAHGARPRVIQDLSTGFFGKAPGSRNTGTTTSRSARDRALNGDT
jgi:hypothetical protein